MYHVRCDLLGNFAGKMANLVVHDIVHSDRVSIILLELLVSPCLRTAATAGDTVSGIGCLVHSKATNLILGLPSAENSFSRRRITSVVSDSDNLPRCDASGYAGAAFNHETRTKSPVQLAIRFIAVLRKVQNVWFNNGHQLRRGGEGVRALWSSAVHACAT